MPTPNETQMQLEVNALKAEIALLKSKQEAAKLPRRPGIKVSPKGAVSLYGLGRFPITLYKEQWLTVLNMERENILAFIQEHDMELKARADETDEEAEARKANVAQVIETVHQQQAAQQQKTSPTPPTVRTGNAVR